MKRFLFGAACALGLVLLPGAASAALTLRGALAEPLRIGGEVNYLNLVFTETGTPDDEGLSTYDIGVRIVRPGGAAGGVRIVPVTTLAQRRSLTATPDYVFEEASITVPEGGSDEDHLQVNFDNLGDTLTNVRTGHTAGRIPFVIDATVAPGRYDFVFQDTVFATGIEGRPLQIPVTLDDAGVINVVPEPAGLSLLGLAGLLALRRRRTA